MGKLVPLNWQVDSFSTGSVVFVGALGDVLQVVQLGHRKAAVREMYQSPGLIRRILKFEDRIIISVDTTQTQKSTLVIFDKNFNPLDSVDLER